MKQTVLSALFLLLLVGLLPLVCLIPQKTAAAALPASAPESALASSAAESTLPQSEPASSMPEAAQSVEFSQQQISDALAGALGIELSGDASGWFGATQWYNTGYVQSVQVGGQSVAGVQLRKALGLRSNCFSISFSEGKFFILTHGYGHGVGLSQWGAHLMAEQGADWHEILAHYFPGTEITGG